MATKKFIAGEVLLAAGAVPDIAYRIQQGSVELTRQATGGGKPVAVLDRGDLIGANELIDGTAMTETAQALGALTVEEISKEQAMRLLGRRAPAKRSDEKKSRDADTPSTKSQLITLPQSGHDSGLEDPASSVLKPGLLRRLLKPEFADVYDRLDVRIAALTGEGGDQASAHLTSELNKRRGLRARAVNISLRLNADAEPLAAMADLKRGAARWLTDNGGDVLVWGERPPGGGFAHIRMFVRDDALVDAYRIGDGWTMLALPEPLDAAGAHRLHAALLAALRTKAAGKLLTVRRDLEVLIADAREIMLSETAGLHPMTRAEDRAAIARIYANATKQKRRAEDARTAITLLDQSLDVFSFERTPLQWAMAHRDRALLGQFVAERTNDADALRGSIANIEAAITVLGPTRFPFDWASLNDRLGRALYRLDFDNGDPEPLERALGAFEDALEVFDRRKTPIEWAETMAHLGQVALVIGRERRSPSTLLRAVEACNAVVSVRDRKSMPQHWASAQNNLGSALFLYGRVAGDTNALQGARDAFQTAYSIYVEKGSDRLARVAAKNLVHVDRALTRRPKREQPPQLPWEPNEAEPPTLPWELEPRDAARQLSASREDFDEWLDEHRR